MGKESAYQDRKKREDRENVRRELRPRDAKEQKRNYNP
jgi:hypothetical protein